jgi:hypothetical protein
LLDYLPSNIIVKTGTPERYMAIAAPLQAECKPISLGWKLRVLWLIAAAANLICFNRLGPESKCVEPFLSL